MNVPKTVTQLESPSSTQLQRRPALARQLLLVSTLQRMLAGSLQHGFTAWANSVARAALGCIPVCCKHNQLDTVQALFENKQSPSRVCRLELPFH